MNNNTHTQYTIVFMWKPKVGQNHIMFFLMSLRITFIGSTNFLCFPAAIGRRLQPPSFSGHNLREAPTPQFSCYNPLVSQATTWGNLQLPKYLAITRRRLQPPMFFGYNRKVATTTCPCPILPPWSSIMMEPLSHYHREIYHCKPIPINLNHASTMHQPVPKPLINLYHKQVHQLCTNMYQTTCNQPVP